MNYQYDFSSVHRSMFDVEERGRKARTAVKVLRHRFGDSIEKMRLLNVGSSTGIMDTVFAGHFRSVLGIDIDEGAIEHATREHRLPNLSFRCGDALNIPVDDSTFDIVVCSQVYEHVPDQGKLMSEIFRVTKPGGSCYFAATNRFILVEPHYRLPFLSWLPPRLADTYLRATGRGENYYERMRSLRHLILLTQNFRVEDYTRRIVCNPSDFDFGYMVSPGSFRQAVAKILCKYAPGIFPGYIWLLHRE